MFACLAKDDMNSLNARKTHYETPGKDTEVRLTILFAEAFEEIQMLLRPQQYTKFIDHFGGTRELAKGHCLEVNNRLGRHHVKVKVYLKCIQVSKLG